MEPAYRMLAFDEGTAAPAADVARLHEALLPQSPIPLLGREFMERFYYSVLPQEGSIRGAVAYVDNQAAGFIVVTHDAAGFMRAALRRHWARIGWLIGTSVLLSPKRIAYVWEALQVMRSAPPPAAEAGAVGQILSFGVLPTYRDFGFVRRTGLKIGVDLLKRGILALEARGVREIRAAVETQNLEAQLFYRGQGFRLTRTHLPGWRVSAVELAWRSDGLKV